MIKKINKTINKHDENLSFGQCVSRLGRVIFPQPVDKHLDLERGPLTPMYADTQQL